MEEFKYTHLHHNFKEVRLLRLLPGAKDNVIRCILGYFSLKIAGDLSEPTQCSKASQPSSAPNAPADQSKRPCAPPYRALSYTWGPPKPIRDIRVNGRRYAIRQNLYDFLELAKDRDYGHLWIDQICIDQAHISERNHQVSMMEDIFRNSLEVLAWTGREQISDCILSVMGPETLRQQKRKWRIALSLPLQDQSFGTEGSRNLPSQESCQASTNVQCLRSEAASSESTLSSLHTLVFELDCFSRRPYFSRIWIIQELLLAPRVKVLCGCDTLEWTSLCDLLLAIKDYFFNHRVYRKTVQTLLQSQLMTLAWSSSQAEVPMDLDYAIAIYAIRDYRRFMCSDTRDRWFGLQGIVKPDQRIATDYTLTDKELFEIYMPAIAILEAEESKSRPQVSRIIKKYSEFLSSLEDGSRAFHLTAWEVDMLVDETVARVTKLPRTRLPR